jgi:tetratricopeptide (TPR) repeat protein
MSDGKLTIEQSFRALDEAGFKRPSGMTVDEFVAGLAAVSAVPPDVGRDFLKGYHEARYRGGEASDGAALLDSLDAKRADAWQQHVLDWRANGGDAPAPPVPKTTTAPVATPAPTPASLQPQPATTTPRGHLTLSPEKLQRLVIVLFLWTLIAFGVGAWQHDWVNDTVTQLQIKLGIVEPPPRPSGLSQLRFKAVVNPDSSADWIDLASAYADRRQYGDAVTALQHVIAREPDNARALNDLAWLYCTAIDTFYVDLKQALLLAERAYAIDPHHAIADTLAEACFLNGDPGRAVELATRAIAENPEKLDHYSRQLEKFRRAAKARE